MFPTQVQRDISTAVQYLAPICEKKGWPADPFDRLIAMRVEASLAQDQKNIQDVYTLIAKLRRKYGLAGGNFYGQSQEKKKRGARMRYDPREDAKVYNAWATGRYLTYAACAAALGGENTARTVETAVDRHEHRVRKTAVKRF